MGSFAINFFLLFMGTCLHLNAITDSGRILFLLNRGEITQAIDHYQTLQAKKGKHDFELLQQMSLILLDSGFRSSEPEDQLMAIYGAGISMNDRTFYLLEEGLKSPFPQIQVIALNFLSGTQNDNAYELIHQKLGSPFGIIRLEAAQALALIKHPKATIQIEALMQKVDACAWPVFPKLLAYIGDDTAIKILRKLMTHPDHEVRIAAIIAAVEFGRDDLLPQIRKLASQNDPRQKESAALALGVFQDHASKETLKRLSNETRVPVRMAALYALILLGDKNKINELTEIAFQGNPFAITLLGEINGTEESLAALATSRSSQVRLNAALALLERKDERCIPAVLEILVQDMRDLAYAEITTPGKALSAWKAIPSASHQGDEAEIIAELSLKFRENVLTQALNLPGNSFLQIAEILFEKSQVDLIPLLTNLLVNLDTPETVALLKKQQQKIGAPLIRQWANLALVKMGEEGNYKYNLKQAILQKQDLDIIKLRAVVPFALRDTDSNFELLPHESAELLIESLGVLVESDEEEGIDFLLKVIKEGHARNRFVIAGLLLQATSQ